MRDKIRVWICDKMIHFLDYGMKEFGVESHEEWQWVRKTREEFVRLRGAPMTPAEQIRAWIAEREKREKRMSTLATYASASDLPAALKALRNVNEMIGHLRSGVLPNGDAVDGAVVEYAERMHAAMSEALGGTDG